MAGKSKIQWTENTWNPIVGCSIVSPGCTNCYAMRDAWRKHHNPKLPHYHGLTKKVNGHAVWTGVVRQAPEHILLQPLRTRKPTTWFVNSMSDLFHESVPDEWIDKVFAVMAQCPQHTFQVLTKRAERMRDYMTREIQGPWAGRAVRIGDDGIARPETDVGFRMRSRVLDLMRVAPADALNRACKFMDDRDGGEGDGFFRRWPLPNVWLGVSAERQQEADERIPHLLQTPAATRFVSAEPLLGPIDLSRIAVPNVPGCWLDALTDYGAPKPSPCLDWVIVGGESGPHAREHDLQWSRGLIAQCKAAGVAVFEKQLGSAPFSARDKITYRGRKGSLPSSGFWRYLKNKKGGDWSEWPDDLRVREMPLLPSALAATSNNKSHTEKAERVDAVAK